MSSTPCESDGDKSISDACPTDDGEKHVTQVCRFKEITPIYHRPRTRWMALEGFVRMSASRAVRAHLLQKLAMLQDILMGEAPTGSEHDEVQAVARDVNGARR